MLLILSRFTVPSYIIKGMTLLFLKNELYKHCSLSYQTWPPRQCERVGVRSTGNMVVGVPHDVFATSGSWCVYPTWRSTTKK